MQVLEVPTAFETAELLEDEPQLVRHRLNVDEYARMVETGVLQRGARVELVEGEIIHMAPTATRHHAAVMRLNQALQAAVKKEAIVLVQASLQLGRNDQVEPDLALLKARNDFYVGALPTGPDTLLVIEVSDSSLAYDIRTKSALYARGGVPEYWVVDLKGRALRRFRLPQDDGWREIMTSKDPGLVTLPGLHAAEIDLSELF